MERTALIVGAAGGIGSETARALVANGWKVRALARQPDVAMRSLSGLREVQWVRGDALEASEVMAAASGVNVIVHAVNPPGYRNWQTLALPMLDSTVRAARANGARIVLPGTIYNYGPDSFPRLSEGSPQQPKTRKGAIRVAMERRLQDAVSQGAQVLIVRAGDFFGANAKNSWFSQAVIKPGRAVRSLMYPGKAGVGHAWAYLPDVAETIARLLDREAELQPFDTFHFRGHWFENGDQMADAVRRVAGRPNAPIRRFPWFAAFLLAPFVPTFREMLEMRYLWSTSIELDNRKLIAFLGREPHTPLDRAIEDTLRGLGCLPATSDASVRPALSSSTLASR